jgi:AcrR family transcriptional regulator
MARGRVRKSKVSKPKRSEDADRSERRRAVSDYRREMILAAARRVFAAQGLEGASLRAIAKEAGYTHGALYFYYASKEQIYGDLLAGSLDRLADAVHAATGPAAPAERLRASALAFFDYYRDNPGDLDLGFYLFRGMKPLGLTRELNAELNDKLRMLLGEWERALRALGLPPEAAERETAALFGHAVGLLLLVHTGRMRMFGLDGRELMADYVDRLAARPPAVAQPHRLP